MGRELGRTAPSHRSADPGINLFRSWRSLSTRGALTPSALSSRSIGNLLVFAPPRHRLHHLPVRSEIFPRRSHIVLTYFQYSQKRSGTRRLIRREAHAATRTAGSPARSSRRRTRRGTRRSAPMSFAPSPVSIRNLRPAPWERGHLARSFSPLRPHVVRAISRVSQKPPSRPLGTRASCPLFFPDPPPCRSRHLPCQSETSVQPPGNAGILRALFPRSAPMSFAPSRRVSQKPPSSPLGTRASCPLFFAAPPPCRSRHLPYQSETSVQPPGNAGILPALFPRSALMSFAPSPVLVRNPRPAPWERGHLARSFSPLRAHVVRAISRVSQKRSGTRRLIRREEPAATRTA